MVHSLVLRIGKRFSPAVRSAVYLSARKVQATLGGVGLRVGETSGTIEAARSLWRSRAAVRVGSHRPWDVPPSVKLPDVDVTAVTFNSARSIEDFLDSLLELDYPMGQLSLCLVDNASTDDTLALIERRTDHLRSRLRSVTVERRPNLGFGTGQNFAIAKGSAPFILITNVDLRFEPSALRTLVGRAQSDPAEFASWEARQFPYEHPKYYDPVSLEVTWSSSCCVLMRRSAFERVEGYDERIFLYGEDVDLSYRLRSCGFRLGYVPSARVFHFALDSETRDVSKQHFGGVLSNGLIRRRFGDPPARLLAPIRIVRLAFRWGVSPAYRLAILRLVAEFVGTARHFRPCPDLRPGFPIRGWNYELERFGAAVHLGGTDVPPDLPLVSIVTRTVGNRPDLLLEAMATVANQTYPHVEHIVVEDGGEKVRGVVEGFVGRTGHRLRYLPSAKSGRCAAGNAGMQTATGEFLLFLDDDDLLFADHIETLARRLLSHPGCVAAYSLSWEAFVRESPGWNGPESGHQLHALHNQEFDHEVLAHHNFMTIQSVLFRRSLFEERGGFNENLDVLEDWNLWVRFAAGNRFVYIPRVTSIYRTPVHPRSRETRRRALSSAYDDVRSQNQSDMQIYEASTTGLVRP